MAFACQAVDVCDRLSKTTAGSHVADQLLRSATSAASNHTEARGAESNWGLRNFETFEIEEIDEEMLFDLDGVYAQVRDMVETGKILR